MCECACASLQSAADGHKVVRIATCLIIANTTGRRRERFLFRHHRPVSSWRCKVEGEEGRDPAVCITEIRSVQLSGVEY